MNKHSQQELQMEDFDMLLNEVLEDLANPSPTDALKEKVMLRLRSAQAEAAEYPGNAAHAEMRPVLSFERAATDRRPGSTILAFALHAATILFVLSVVRPRVQTTHEAPALMINMLETPPPVVPLAHRTGGGGGQRGPAPVDKGTPPKFSPTQIVPPLTPPAVQAKLEVPPTIDVQTNLKMASAMPEIGEAHAPNVGASMGNGDGSGLGSGRGSGMGFGSGGNTGGGVKEVGGSVSAPVEIYKVDPEFSDEARRAKLSGSVLVNLWVDQSGKPTHVRVLQGLGMGLDEKAIDAVKQFRFKPAMENGKPVTVELNVEVSFHIY